MPEARESTVESFRQRATRLLELGEPLAAYDVASDGLRQWPRDLRLRQLRGVSLSRSGAVEDAAAAFRELAAEGQDDEETLGNLARTYKAIWLAGRGGKFAERLRRDAQQAYHDAYLRTGGYWTCINAAALALAGGDRSTAEQLAAAVLAQCRELLEAAAQQAGDDGYWLRATCGEASLILGRSDEALRWYRQATEVAGRRYANIATTRSQARMVCELVDVDWPMLDSCFALPRIVVFTGHMIDGADRAAPRFPAGLAESVRREIDRRLGDWQAVVGYSSAACGADLLFLESLLAREQDAVVVLPFAAEQFAESSVDFAGGDWTARFHAALARVGEPIVASSWKSPASGAAYDYANRMLCGLAKIQADLLDVPLVLLAVWDGESPDEPGGAASLVHRWQRQGLPMEAIDLRALRAHDRAALPAVSNQARSTEVDAPSRNVSSEEGKTKRKRPPAPRDAPQLVAMLFADIQGFSTFSDEQIVPFVRRLLDRVARLMRNSDQQPLATNTWGDGFFATFRGVGEAGRFALRLARLIQDADWERYGLPADLNIRIALHAGPAYALRDPVTGRPSYWGGHVSRAARMEPITPPGQVYASQAFAALARDEEDCEFVCQYVGRTPLAKNYGSFPTYHVTARHLAAEPVPRSRRKRRG